MSAPAGEGGAQPSAQIEQPPEGNPLFSSIMDVFGDAVASAAGVDPATTPEAAGAVHGAPAAGAATAAPAAPGGGEAVQPASSEPAGAAAAPAGDPGAGGAAPAGGAAGTPAGTPAVVAPGSDSGARPADWTASPESLNVELGNILTKFEERTAAAYQQEALSALRTEHAQYFEHLEQHPRLLVGLEVPAIGKEGKERLKDSNDAREWQEAVKSILADEIQDRTAKMAEDNKGFLDTVHASIQLFQNNPDLIPGSAKFDVDLANRFTEMAKPYELRVNGKLQGYAIPVQPLVESLRAQVAATRAAAPPATPPAPAGTPNPVDPPQAGIQSKAGSSTEVEDFSTLFGTLGLPNLRI